MYSYINLYNINITHVICTYIHAYILVHKHIWFYICINCFRLSQTCNHVAALLFKVESAFRLDMSQPACTTAACSWKAPSKKPVFMALDEMVFKRPTHKKGKGNVQANAYL